MVKFAIGDRRLATCGAGRIAVKTPQIKHGFDAKRKQIAAGSRLGAKLHTGAPASSRLWAWCKTGRGNESSTS